MKRKVGTSTATSEIHHHHDPVYQSPKEDKSSNTSTTYKTPRWYYDYYRCRSSSSSSSSLNRYSSKKKSRTSIMIFSIIVSLLLLVLLQSVTATIYINYDTSKPILRRNITSLMNYNATVQQSTSSNGIMEDADTSSSSSSLPNIMGSSKLITVAYDTLPGLFGRYMMDGVLYQARIQYIPENPYLCTLDGITSFQNPPDILNSTWSSVADSTSINNNNNNNRTAPVSDDNTGTNTTNTTSSSSKQDNTTTTTKGNNDETVMTGDAIILLVSRGECPFYQKALNAEQLHPNILFLAIYNNPGDNTLVPMYSQSVTTRLVLLSLSYNAGQEIIQYITNEHEYNNTIYQLGGPYVELDSSFPTGIMPPNWIPGNDINGNGYYNDGQQNNGLFNMQDLQQTFISVIGLFLLTVSCMGIMILIATLYGQHRRFFYQNYIPGSTGNNGTTGQQTNDPNIKLLTVDDVKQLYIIQYEKQKKEQQQQELLEKEKTDSIEPQVVKSTTNAAPSEQQDRIKDVVASLDDQQQQQQPFDEVSLNNVTAKKENDEEKVLNNNNSTSNDDNEEEEEENDEFFNHIPENACAICLDEIECLLPKEEVCNDDCLATTDTDQQPKDSDSNSIIIDEENAALLLPCGQHHKFHYNCIMPWLTERQAKCPLCKYDIYEYMRQIKEQQKQNDDTGSAAGNDIDKENSQSNDNSNTNEHPNVTIPTLPSDDDQQQQQQQSTSTPVSNGRSFLRRFNNRRHHHHSQPTQPVLSSSSSQQQHAPEQAPNSTNDGIIIDIEQPPSQQQQ